MRYLNVMSVSTALLLSNVMMLEPPPDRYDQPQVQTTAQEKAASLRSQLSDVESKQAELQARLQKLDENLKSESIEHSLAGIGSTRPEDLREQRRRQLEIERNGVQAQLNLLAASHGRLEIAIAQADAEAYRQSAAPVTASSTPKGPSIEGANSAPATDEAAPPRSRRIKRKRTRKSRKTHHAQILVEVS
jgi:DNA repair exonuclease SbcCD ATPase subunit